MKEMEKYYVQINFDDTGKFGDKFINEFNSDDKKKKIVYINPKVPIEKFVRHEELSKMEKLILMMQMVDKELVKEIAGDDNDLKKVADVICKNLEQNPIVKGIVKKLEHDISKAEENVRE